MKIRSTKIHSMKIRSMKMSRAMQQRSITMRTNKMNIRVALLLLAKPPTLIILCVLDPIVFALIDCYMLFHCI